MTTDAASGVRTVRIAESVSELLAGAESRTPWKNADSLSGSLLDRVRIGGAAYILKTLTAGDDWLMRACGDDGTRQMALFTTGILERLPRCIDHAVVGVATGITDSGGRSTALLMRDVSTAMLRTDRPATPDTHRQLLTSMAAVHAAYWGAEDADGLIPLDVHYTFLGPETALRERARGGVDAVPQAVGAGWERLRASSPRAGNLALSLARDPGPLVAGLRGTPQTLVHGDWKFGNLGEHPDGRTVLLDWDRAGIAPAALDLAWYLAVNCDLLPESKESAIAAYAHALASSGVAMGAWWDVQLRLALLGAFVQLGWSKAGGNSAELGWWEERALDAESLL